MLLHCTLWVETIKHVALSGHSPELLILEHSTYGTQNADDVVTFFSNLKTMLL